MSRTWKPGDVALVNNRSHPEDEPQIGFCYQGGAAGDARWRIIAGEVWTSVSEVRPLVVIDPENYDHSERLTAALHNVRARSIGRSYPGDLWDRLAPQVRYARVDDMRGALREYANPTPPKPAEPTDPAVRVLDSDGQAWVSFEGQWSILGVNAKPRPWDELLADYGPLEIRP